MNQVFIDIETIPCQDDEISGILLDNIQPRANLKDPEKIQADIAAKMDAVASQTALDGTFGEICCIGYAIANEPVQTLSRGLDKICGTEKDLLEVFMERMNAACSFNTHPKWIGHNVCFDLRFIWQRCIINEVRMPVRIPNDVKPWSQGIYDTLFQWCGTDLKNHGLENLCRVFGLPKKPFPSNTVYDLYKAGAHAGIAELCAHDVDMVRELYRRMSGDDRIEPVLEPLGEG